MPHDKVLWNAETSKYDRFVAVDIESNEEIEESIEKDALIEECLAMYL